MNEDEILPPAWKYYIAIQAVSCYECEYLLKILEEQYLLNGGRMDWITEGLKKVDPKLQKLAELNEILAFKPWTLSGTNLEKLIKGSNWSLPEVIVAGIILADYHSLCGFVQGMGLVESTDFTRKLAKAKTLDSPAKKKGLDEDSTLAFLKEKVPSEGKLISSDYKSDLEELEKEEGYLQLKGAAPDSIPPLYRVHRLGLVRGYENFNPKQDQFVDLQVII